MANRSPLELETSAVKTISGTAATCKNIRLSEEWLGGTDLVLIERIRTNHYSIVRDQDHRFVPSHAPRVLKDLPSIDNGRTTRLHFRVYSETSPGRSPGLQFRDCPGLQPRDYHEPEHAVLQIFTTPLPSTKHQRQPAHGLTAIFGRRSLTPVTHPTSKYFATPVAKYFPV